MLARCFALLIIPTLPFAPLMFPFGTAQTANVIAAGILASALALFSLVNNRARVAVAVLGGWVALTPFIFHSTLPEQVITVAWGVSTFVFMAGPFSDSPRVYRTPALVPAADATPRASDSKLPAAA